MRGRLERWSNRSYGYGRVEVDVTATFASREAADAFLKMVDEWLKGAPREGK
jgi:hypothetical protein